MYQSDAFEADSSSGFDSMLGGGEGNLNMEKETGGKQECSVELLRTAGEPDSSLERPRLSLSAGGEPSDSSQG